MGDALAPWHIIILVVVLVLLFGARRLPGAAQSLGQSMHIFKKSVQGLNPDDDPATAANPAGQSFMSQPISGAPVPPSASIAAPDQTAQQLADLQRQVAELQRQNAGSNGGPVSEAQSTQPF
ncbi:MAG TPA: Sec-independent protein translocase subunit TatA [Streptosporangiaceae bacterium]|nr:Sec-independent protein translocase subunit TatA [Streptosporangiaceae bacterium]